MQLFKSRITELLSTGICSTVNWDPQAGSKSTLRWLACTADPAKAECRRSVIARSLFGEMKKSISSQKCVNLVDSYPSKAFQILNVSKA